VGCSLTLNVDTDPSKSETIESETLRVDGSEDEELTALEHSNQKARELLEKGAFYRLKPEVATVTEIPTPETATKYFVDPSTVPGKTASQIMEKLGKSDESCSDMEETYGEMQIEYSEDLSEAAAFMAEGNEAMYFLYLQYAATIEADMEALAQAMAAAGC